MDPKSKNSNIRGNILRHPKNQQKNTAKTSEKTQVKQTQNNTKKHAKTGQILASQPRIRTQARRARQKQRKESKKIRFLQCQILRMRRDLPARRVFICIKKTRREPGLFCYSLSGYFLLTYQNNAAKYAMQNSHLSSIRYNTIFI